MKELQQQIHLLHAICPRNTEWSGLLIWKLVKGGLEDLENIEIEAHAVFPMDFGEAAFTSFEGNENWIKCFEQFPQIDPMSPQPGWYISKIHSHQALGVFHSGTDKSDIYENAPKLPMFLSLIVNYDQKFDCELGIAMKIEETIITKSKWRLKGLFHRHEKPVKKLEDKSKVFILKCDVEVEKDGSWFLQQIERVKNTVKPVTIYHSGTNTGGYDYKNYQRNDLTKIQSKKNLGTTMASKTYKKMVDYLNELLTLGMENNLTAFTALTNIDRDLTVAQRSAYIKAFKYYFMEHWYDSVFYNTNATEIEVLEDMELFIEIHEGKWIGKVLTEAVNELKAEYNKLWKIQRSSLV